MNEAKLLLDRYKKAKVVFTSLIHCAFLVLPWAHQSCLSMLVLTIMLPREIVLVASLTCFPIIVDIDLPFGKRTLLQIRTDRVVFIVYRLCIKK